MSKPLTGVIGFLAVVLMYLSACESPNTTFEESIEPYMELQAIEEASNSSITVNQGETHGLDSYFAFDIGNIQQNGFISEGLVEGWCLEWNKPISQNNDTHHGTELYSTYGSKSWKPANYLMSIKDNLKANDPDLTYREIQVALWTLIEEPRFDLDKVLNEGRMPSRLMTDGNPNFNVEKVKEITSKVRSEVANFKYSSNSDYLIFARTDDELQNGGTTIKCGSFRTQTMGGWGQPPNGNNNGQFLQDNFNTIFPEGLVVGGDKTISFTSAEAIRNFLPQGGQSIPLSNNETNPTSNLGNFAGQVVTLAVTLGFDENIDTFSDSSFKLSQLIVNSGDFEGESVGSIFNEASRILGGGAEDEFSINQLKDIIDSINNSFVDGGVRVDSQQLLKCPESLTE